VSNFSRFKDILDLEYRVLYFSIMEKTHIEIETNIMGKECVLYMQPYDNLPPRLSPYCLSRGGLSRRLLCPIACCPLRLSAQDKICPRWQSGKRKIRAVCTVSTMLHIAIVPYILISMSILLLHTVCIIYCLHFMSGRFIAVVYLLQVCTEYLVWNLID